mgnify:CR=1 FL=1
MQLFMKDSKQDISGNLIYRYDNAETHTRFESSNDLKKLIHDLGSGDHSGDIELDGSSVIVFNGVKKSSLVDLVNSLSDGEIYEKYYTEKTF